MSIQSWMCGLPTDGIREGMSKEETNEIFCSLDSLLCRFWQYGRRMVWMVRMVWMFTSMRRRSTTKNADVRRPRLPIVRVWRPQSDGTCLQFATLQGRLELLDRLVSLFRYVRTRQTIAFAYLFDRRWWYQRVGCRRLRRPFHNGGTLQQSQLRTWDFL